MEFDRAILEDKAAILKLISHPIRLCILRGLSEEGEKNVSYIQGCLDVPQSTLSQHLAKLRLSGVVKDERRGTEVFYSLADDEVRRIIKLLFKSEEE